MTGTLFSDRSLNKQIMTPELADDTCQAFGSLKRPFFFETSRKIYIRVDLAEQKHDGVEFRGLIIESPGNFSCPKTSLSNFNMLLLKSSPFNKFSM